MSTTERSPKARRGMKIGLAGTAAIGLSALVLAAGCSAGSSDSVLPPVGTPTSSQSPRPVTNDKSYTLTQIVTNNSSQALTLTNTWVDNGGKITQQPATVQAKSTQSYVATNYGNGVQLKLTFTATNGATVHVDTDLPKNDGPWTVATIKGPHLGITNITENGDPDLVANVYLADCTGGCDTNAGAPALPPGVSRD